MHGNTGRPSTIPSLNKNYNSCWVSTYSYFLHMSSKMPWLFHVDHKYSNALRRDTFFYVQITTLLIMKYLLYTTQWTWNVDEGNKKKGTSDPLEDDLRWISTLHNPNRWTSPKLVLNNVNFSYDTSFFKIIWDVRSHQFISITKSTSLLLVNS